MQLPDGPSGEAGPARAPGAARPAGVAAPAAGAAVPARRPGRPVHGGAQVLPWDQEAVRAEISGTAGGTAGEGELGFVPCGPGHC